MPNQMKVYVYNSAGEQVLLLFDGGISVIGGAPTLDSSLISSGYSGANLNFMGQLSSGGKSLYWNGVTDNGGMVSGGIYYFKVEQVDPFGAVTSYTIPIQVIEPKGENKISIFNSAGELVYEESFRSLTFTVSDLALLSTSFAPSFDATGLALSKLDGYLRDGNGGSYAWNWDGRNSNGTVVSPGVYSIVLLMDAPAGGQQKVIKQVQVLAALDSNDASPAIYGVHPITDASLKGGLVLTYRSAATSSVRARIYNLAGELIAEAADGSPSGSLILRPGSMSSGIYIIEFEYRTPSGSNTRSNIKAAILR